MLRYAQWKGDWNPRYGNPRWHKLHVAVRATGFDADIEWHRALGDTIACRHVWRYLERCGWVQGRLVAGERSEDFSLSALPDLEDCPTPALARGPAMTRRSRRAGVGQSSRVAGFRRALARDGFVGYSRRSFWGYFGGRQRRLLAELGRSKDQIARRKPDTERSPATGIRTAPRTAGCGRDRRFARLAESGPWRIRGRRRSALRRLPGKAGPGH